MSNYSLYINSFSYPVTNLGPGKRFVLWVEGCSLKCPGCMALSMQRRRQSSLMTIDYIFNVIKQSAQELDGITISGGEPFEQADDLLSLIQLIKHETNLDIMVYSGYTIEELRLHSASANSILEMIDILVDGRFKEQERNSKLWRGSDNQGIHLLSETSSKYLSYKNEKYNGKRHLLFELDNRNVLKIIGIPERGFTRQFESALTGKGLFIQ